MRHRHYRGMSLIELLMALALAATLLTAIAMSVHSAIQSHRANVQYAELTSRARIAMLNMTNLLRNASIAAPYTESVANTDFAKGGTVDPDTGARTGYVDDVGFCVAEYDPYAKNMKPPKKTSEVRWDKKTKRLEMQVDKSKWQTLARGVTAFNVRLRPMQSETALYEHGLSQHFDTVEEVTISMTISPDAPAKGGDVSMVCSVVPRQVVWNGEKLPLRIYTFLNSNL